MPTIFAPRQGHDLHREDRPTHNEKRETISLQVECYHSQNEMIVCVSVYLSYEVWPFPLFPLPRGPYLIYSFMPLLVPRLKIGLLDLQVLKIVFWKLRL